ncbi:MAG: hypothetical protein AB7D51_01795 [Desulfovibrionaceae bacterium]
MTVPDWLGDASKFVSVLVLLLQLAGGWFIWGMRREFVTRKHCDEECLKRRQMQTALTLLEQAQRNAPDSEDMAAIKDRLGGIEGEIKALLATAKGQADLLNRLERPLNLLMEHHLKESK